MWHLEPHNVNEVRERELSNKFFKPALDMGSQMVRHHNTVQSAHDIIQKIVDNHPTVLQIQWELVDERKDIGDTAAGETINRELKDLTRRHQAELKELREEMMEALREKDLEMRQKLKEVKKELREKLEKAEKDLEMMAVNYAVEKEKAEAKMKEMEQEAKEERERAEAEYDRKLAALTSRLQHAINASAGDRAEWEQEIRRLQDRVAIPIYK